MRGHILELDMILRGIVMSRGENGATISEMRSDYYEITSEQWPLRSLPTSRIVQYLLQIDGLMMEKLENGLCIWYIDDIGNVSERLHASNNNNNIIIEITDTSTIDESITDNGHSDNNCSYNLKPPAKPNILTSSFLNARRAAPISSDVSSIVLDKNQENVNKKRRFSQHSPHNDSASDGNKRQRNFVPKKMPLNETNLSIHNQHSGSNMIKKTTSTEVENSSSAQNGINGSIDRILSTNGLQSYNGGVAELDNPELH